MVRLHTQLCDRLGIEHPIVQAGMAVHGAEEIPPSPVALVAAVSNAGGLGVLGDNFHDLDEMDSAITEVRRLVGGRPFGVDFLIPASREEVATSDNREAYRLAATAHPRHAAFVASLIEAHGLTPAEPAERAPMAASGLEPLPFPVQRLLQEPLLRAARAAGRWDLVPNLAGQVAGMITERKPAAQILREMVDEAAAAIEELHAAVRLA